MIGLKAPAAAAACNNNFAVHIPHRAADEQQSEQLHSPIKLLHCFASALRANMWGAKEMDGLTSIGQFCGLFTTASYLISIHQVYNARIHLALVDGRFESEPIQQTPFTVHF